MIRRPPRYTRTDTLFPYTTLFRSKIMGSVDTLLAHKGGRLKKGDNFPDQNVVDLIVALAKTYGLKVDCSQMHEPVPIASDVTTAGGRTIVRGHKTRALFVQNLIRCRRLRDKIGRAHV